jgi:F-type H+-transporting ATPase subunit epsilon
MLTLEILVPDHSLLETRVTSIEAADATGRFGLHAGHEAFVTVLEPCVLIYVDERGIEHYAAVDGGVLYLEADRVSIAAREAVLADRLEDVADLVAATMQQRRKHEKSARSEFGQLQATLVYELGRLDRQPAP